MEEKIKIMTVFGTRPEAIKMAPLVKEFEKYPHLIDSIVTISAQHREMLDQVLNIFDIKPHFDLNIMRENQSLIDMTQRLLIGLHKVIAESKPHIVLVHGDTTTSFVASLAAFYNKIKIGHVEAGLRTYNKFSPFPEEINRQLTGVMADLHFAPTFQAAQNLILENKTEENIFITGNTAIDAFKTTIKQNFNNEILDKLDKDSRLIVVTTHRRENLGEPIRNIFKAVKRIASEFEDVSFVVPVHKNPIVKKIVKESFTNNPYSNILLTEPLNVVDFHNILAKAYMVLTDSGGIQEEAPSLGVPVLVLRNNTERPEGLYAGTLLIAGINEDSIYNMTKDLLLDSYKYNKMSTAINPYGDGYASKRIVEAIFYSFGIFAEKPSPFYSN